jgi:predicted PurR-regulated permease PerM
METASQHKGFILMLGLVTVAFFWLLLPFYGAVLWAVILAIIFQPLQRSLERRLGGQRNLAAMLSVIVCIVIAIIPMTVIVVSLLRQGAQLVLRVQEGELDLLAMLTDLRASLPAWAQSWLERFGAGDLEGLRDRLTDAVASGGQVVAGQVVNVGQNTLHFVASVGVMLYVLFFLFRDGPAVGRSVRDSLPLSDDYSRRLIAMIATVVRATVRGNLIIAVVQGTIGGVTFWLLGIEPALLWGVLMIFLSLLPAVGSALVWVPVAGYLLLTGATAKAVILVLVGVGVIGLIDNLLRPSLVGKDTRLPDYVVLVSTIGGLTLLGINGFVLGPLTAALFIAGWTLFREEQRRARDIAP